MPLPSANKRKFNLSIHGSRTLKDERVKIIILEEIKKYRPTTIVTHAEPGGVCEMARKVCKEMAIPLKLHFLNFRYLRGAFEHRSKDVLGESDHSIFIHDGKSKDTMNELKLAQKMNIPTTLYTIEPTAHKSSVGFPVDGEWDLDFLNMEDLFVLVTNHDRT